MQFDPKQMNEQENAESEDSNIKFASADPPQPANLAFQFPNLLIKLHKARAFSYSLSCDLFF